MFYSVPQCLKSKFSKLESFPPILLGSGKSSGQGKFIKERYKMLGVCILQMQLLIVVQSMGPNDQSITTDKLTKLNNFVLTKNLVNYLHHSC